MVYEFVEGKAYEAIPTLRGARRRMVVCVGRDESRIQFAWADGLTVEDVEMCVGREIVQPRRPNGVYIVSSAVPLDLQAAAAVIDLLSVMQEV